MVDKRCSHDVRSLGYNVHMNLTEITEPDQWDQLVTESAIPHPLQLWGWGELKRLNGWTPYRLATLEGAELRAVAQMLIWQVPKFGWKLAYIPRGPLNESDIELNALADFARSKQAFVLQVEPQWRTVTQFSTKWRQSKRPTLMAETFVLDLSKPEDELQAQMARKTRQYIRKSAADGVVVQADSDGQYFDEIIQVYKGTAARAKFGLQSEKYYKSLLDNLGDNNAVYVAKVDGRVEAFLWVATCAQTAFELYGGVSAIGEEKRANYTLKWTLMRDLKARGVTYYDFNGNLHDGVGRFKQSFGPELVQYVGSMELPLKGAQYQAFSKTWSVAKPLGRLFNKK